MSELWRTVELSFPRTLTLSIGQITQLFLVAIAATLATGSISVFALAYNLQSVPLMVIGASYSVAAFPTLARVFANGETGAFVAQVAAATRHVLFWTLPATALMVVLRAHVVRVTLGSGAFDWTDTRLTAAAFAVLAFALAAQAVSLLLIRAFYASGRSRIPLIVTVGSGICVLAVAYTLTTLRAQSSIGLFVESLLRVEDVAGVSVLMLAFAITVGAVISTASLVVMFQRNFSGYIQSISRSFWEGLAAAGFAGISSYWVLSVLGGISSATTMGAVFYHGGVSGVAGILAAVCAYSLFGSIELEEMKDALMRRVRGNPPQSVEEQHL